MRPVRAKHSFRFVVLIAEIALVAVLPAVMTRGETVARLELVATVPARMEAQLRGFTNGKPEVQVLSNSDHRFAVKVAPLEGLKTPAQRRPANGRDAEIHVVTIEAP